MTVVVEVLKMSFMASKHRRRFYLTPFLLSHGMSRVTQVSVVGNPAKRKKNCFTNCRPTNFGARNIMRQLHNKDMLQMVDEISQMVDAKR